VGQIEKWVFQVSIALPIFCAAVLIVLHFSGVLARRLGKERQAIRESPEPPSKPKQTSTEPTSAIVARDNVPAIRSATGPRAVDEPRLPEDPEQLQRACAALVDSLAEKYLQLAESWRRRGDIPQAAHTLEKLIRSCPETPQAQVAQERLADIRHSSATDPSGHS
jgi:hypothetical protein